MKKLIIIALLLTSALYSKAQEDIAFPFQGGGAVMTKFFMDSVVVSPEIVKKKATGMAILKFTSDINGNVSKIVIYYADEFLITLPVIDALKKSGKRWIIPNKEKFHDFIIPFSIGFNKPKTGVAEVQKAAYAFYRTRKPIVSKDQIPLNSATLLPTVVVQYDLK
ncbi:hypothetical protein [Mucilaginibacter glaciei]|uniref:TonB-like protein n=1 Tax=Mucilaginibacter glaciei TaxID=2772109 RepID=A0A926S381_9SPHI|nr:hypothetical protein [Mucilaginibacter glaciei]MBD1393954.1 hypothetical protein [Mucilaginibacter glaciei]